MLCVVHVSIAFRVKVDILTIAVIPLKKTIDISNDDQVIVLQRIWFVRQLRIRIDRHGLQANS